MTSSKTNRLHCIAEVERITAYTRYFSSDVELLLCGIADELGSDSFIAAIRVFAVPVDANSKNSMAQAFLDEVNLEFAPKFPPTKDYLSSLAIEFKKTDFEAIPIPTATMVLSKAYKAIQNNMTSRPEERAALAPVLQILRHMYLSSAVFERGCDSGNDAEHGR